MPVPGSSSLDRCMADAWPPMEVAPLGPWTLRASQGVTRRANSVQTSRADGAVDVDEPAELSQLVDAAEGFYSNRGLTPVFQVSDDKPPKGLVTELQGRSYAQSASTDILVRSLQNHDAAFDSGSSHALHLDGSGRPPDDWFEFYRRMESDRMQTTEEVSVFRDVLLRSSHSSAFATLTDDLGLASIAQVVVVRKLACIQALASAERARCRGVAGAMIEHLMTEAARLGAHTAFAAVAVDNHASQRVFSRAGFTRSHGYRYWTAAEIRSTSPVGRPG